MRFLILLLILLTFSQAGFAANVEFGSVAMEKNGDITMVLPANHSGGRGNSYRVITSNDADYKRIINEVDGLKPGESKLYPPHATSEH